MLKRREARGKTRGGMREERVRMAIIGFIPIGISVAFPSLFFLPSLMNCAVAPGPDFGYNWP
jgi:hypothetical protein